MTNIPEDEASQPVSGAADDTTGRASRLAQHNVEDTAGDQQPTEITPRETAPVEPGSSAPDPFFVSNAQPGPQLGEAPNPPPSFEPQLFQSFAQPPVRPTVRIPHFGHLSLLALLLVVSSICTGAAFLSASHFLRTELDLSSQAAATSVPLLLASEAITYFLTFVVSFFVFPHFWNKGFFAGLQWRGAVALHRFWPLAATALGCAGLAALDEVLMPGPANAPIDKMFSAPGAAWLMFAFGTTVAPFFEEMFFRGFLLPASSTGFDWIVDRFSKMRLGAPGVNQYPNRSIQAQLIALLILIVPYAALSPRPVVHNLERVLFVLLWGSCIAIWWAISSAGTNPVAAPAFALDASGHPKWSLAAMVASSVLTSLPFALLHVDQQGHSLGPFLLLIVVSLVLCTVRLKTKSLAASTLVHACYNFIIFSLALVGTGGFRHFDKM